MMNHQRQAQLQNLKSRCTHPNMVQNGRLLYYRHQTYDHNEWVGMSYNQQVLGDMIAELAKLRKEVSDLERTYISMAMLRCNVLSQGECMTFPGGGGGTSWWSWLYSVLYPKFKGPAAGPNVPGMPSFPGTGSVPGGAPWGNPQQPGSGNPFYPNTSPDNNFW